MKTAKVIPVFKSGDKSQFNNYRPIALLPKFSKMFEKLLEKRLNSFLTKYNIINESQYGFQSVRSTAMAINDLVESVADALDNKMSTIGVFIDLKKAFDTLNHEILVKKLEHYGIQGIASKWIISYLTSRKQYVNIQDTSSEHKEILCGIPQGSTLGPKLFIIYINEICNISPTLKFTLFADEKYFLFWKQY